MQEAGPSGRATQRGGAPTRRALFPARSPEVDDWSVAASRNLDAPEMGSLPSSDEEEDDSSSGSSEVRVSHDLPDPLTQLVAGRMTVRSSRRATRSNITLHNRVLCNRLHDATSSMYTVHYVLTFRTGLTVCIQARCYTVICVSKDKTAHPQLQCRLSFSSIA